LGWEAESVPDGGVWMSSTRVDLTIHAATSRLQDGGGNGGSLPHGQHVLNGCL
jgi:hypothetical protein